MYAYTLMYMSEAHTEEGIQTSRTEVTDGCEYYVSTGNQTWVS